MFEYYSANKKHPKISLEDQKKSSSQFKWVLYRVRLKTRKKDLLPNLNGILTPNSIEDLKKNLRNLVSTRPPYSLTFGCNAPIEKSKRTHWGACTPFWKPLV